MRDDIHKRLRLPRPWRNLVRVATRDASHLDCERLAQNAVAAELEDLSEALVAAATRSAEQPHLFGGVAPNLRELATTPIEQEFIRELAAAPQPNPRDAMAYALERATHTRMGAHLRSVRIHTACESPRDVEPLNARLTAAIRACDTRQLVARRLGGERTVTAPRQARRHLDLDMDLRGGVR